MASSLRVNAIIPSSGTNVAIGTAGGTITYNANVSGVSTFSNGISVGTGASINSPSSNTLKINAGIANSDAVTIGGGNFLYGVPSNAVYDTNGGANVGDYWFGQFGSPSRGNSGTKVMVGAADTVSFVGFAHTNSSNVSIISSIVESRLFSNTAGSESALLNILTKPSTSRTVTALSIDGSGRVTTPLQPSFFAYVSTGDTTTADSTIIVFNTTAHNIGSHYSTSTGRFTAPVSGVYAFHAQIWAKNGTGYSRAIFRVAGSQVTQNGFHANTVGNANDHSFQMSMVRYVAAGDAVDVMVNLGPLTYYGGGAQSHTYFTGYLVG